MLGGFSYGKFSSDGLLGFVFSSHKCCFSTQFLLHLENTLSHQKSLETEPDTVLLLSSSIDERFLFPDELPGTKPCHDIFLISNRYLTKRSSRVSPFKTAAADKMMLSYVTLQPGSTVEKHSHPHEQVGILVQGEATFFVGEETRKLKPGDMYRIPGGVEHKSKWEINSPLHSISFRPSEKIIYWRK